MKNTTWQGVIEEYREFLPVNNHTPVVTLMEGNTPLILSKALSKKIGKNGLVYLKCEGMNPTGSFKDRGMSLAVSKAKEVGSKILICASTGNTSASAAAYGACAGIRCVVLIPKGAIAMGKLAQALIHGATVLAIDGNFDQAFKIVREITQRHSMTLVNSLNPFRLEGQKTAAFEICEQLDTAPEFHLMPVGNAGNITAYWKGYKEYRRAGKIHFLPKMLGFQAAGAAPIVKGKPIDSPKTVATAISIGNPASWKGAVEARDESGGDIRAVSDQEIIEAYRFIAENEGIFVEPASAASVAGLLSLSKSGYFKKYMKNSLRIVCVLTGHGLKDPERAISILPKPKIIPPQMEGVLKAIEKS